ncbi:hypothetical protein BKA66DRAFT_459585 [Pyrenochaeta sp. MPI-SDFR-AT-0127]|nr:hypothetical protein BKA66DRAFT_459585 [Pyrenochaeta sp. MPI-SDFR-AT-0127]
MPLDIPYSNLRFIASAKVFTAVVDLSYPLPLLPLDRNGSHADTNVPIGGYVCPSRSTRGAQVHHCSEGTLLMTPATCFPQPHHVVLSRYR